MALTLAITIDIDLTALVRRGAAMQVRDLHCGIRTVGYRFVGIPGQEFRYAGDAYVMPAEGWIELLAERRVGEYEIAGRKLPLQVWPLDQFGFREVPLPKPHAAPKHSVPPAPPTSSPEQTTPDE